MQLRPRHYILLAVVIALFVYNIIKHRHDEHARLAAIQANPLAAPAWAAYDKAAALRDAPDDQFNPAFTALRTATEGPGTEAPDMAQALIDVVHCKIWLNIYRTPDWRSKAQKHIDGCTKFHRDTVA
jgi:hypothetical protein